MTGNGTAWSYKYDSDGLRTERSDGTTTYEYVYSGSSLVHMSVGSNLLYFTYDGSTPMTVTYNGTVYYYVTNLQGDVIAILDGSGNPVVQYTYDAWGKLLSVTGSMANSLGEINPLRYRGYVYDNETQRYYLQSRYYDPALCRFLNADDVSLLGADGTVLSYNLFAYCQNNPVNMTDDDGNWPSWATKFVVGTVVIATAAVLTVATAGTGTALACFAVGALKGAAVGAAVGAASGAATGAVTHRIATGSWNGAGQAALEGAADGYMGGAIGGLISGGMTSNVCFVAGTSVLAATGSVAIENVKTGDRVWAWDEETGDVALKEVVETYVNETDELIHVFVNGEEIVTTPAHPFYSPIKGWTDAVHLRAGDILVLLNGEYVVVEKVQHEILETPVTVYNFQVEDFHTYYVANGVLVHNTCKKYYKATRTDNGIDIGPEITKKQALSRLRNGDDVYASSRAAAKALAKDAYGNSKVYSEIHKYLPNAKKHFHDMVNHSFHVFFD